ncbi:hypothetical protein ACOACQ_17655 [Nocardioides sp. CPCC 206347]|uniref:hypothetical protein n=1 Tax=unclassified Nocardioides TaxID=2615069 RepID=UPI0036087CC6
MDAKVVIESLEAMIDRAHMLTLEEQASGPFNLDLDPTLRRVMGDVAGLAVIVQRLVEDLYLDPCDMA